MYAIYFFGDFDSYDQGSWNNILQLKVRLTEINFFNGENNHD